MRTLVILGSVAWVCAAATVVPGDSQRGEQLFRGQGCVACHSINGQGGNTAPDLGKRIDRNFTPSLLAGLMWNHAPAMWAAMEQKGVTRPRLDEQAASDLFAYFYSTRFFDKPGDAGRGKQVFAARHCAECHGITSSVAAGAPPVNKWESLGHPIILVQQMWNHAAQMRQAFASKKLEWQELTSQELTDILVYLRNLPETRGLDSRFFFGPMEGGEALFSSKGCVKCHTGKLSLERRFRNRTLTDIAVEMWNHAPLMVQPPPRLEQDEMRQIVSYIWARQFFQSAGNAARGKRVFESKNCAACHNNPASGAPSLAGHPEGYSDIGMIAVLWQHGPQMLERMRQKNLAWPRFDGSQMQDLIAYLNTLK